jgi:hypothetical protein
MNKVAVDSTTDTALLNPDSCLHCTINSPFRSCFFQVSTWSNSGVRYLWSVGLALLAESMV